MLLTVTTTHRPATDLGYLVHKSPFRCQSLNLPFGALHTFYPEATEERCTLAMLLDVDPVGLVRRGAKTASTMPLEQYVNDRPYVCSSFMSVALSRGFGQTLNGTCKARPELVETRMPLVARISVLPCRGGEPFLRRLFEPLDYTVHTEGHALDSSFPQWGRSNYFTVELSTLTTVARLFNHLYVLIPVLDDQKHYYVDESEIAKLLKRGEGWLAGHPEKEQIANRFLKHRRSYAQEALERLSEVNPAEAAAPDDAPDGRQPDVEEETRLDEDRLGSVLAALRAVKPESVIDLGCGEGKLLRLLLQDKDFKKVVGFDVSIRSLETASNRLNLRDLPPKQRERLQLVHGSLMYRDRRIEGFDAAAIVEVIEHLDQPRLRAFERVVFEFAKPGTIVLTTPNREYNVVWAKVGPTGFRHGDHRFEWTRKEFSEWAGTMARQYGYDVRFLPVGREIEGIGAPTQMAVFSTRQPGTGPNAGWK